MQAQSDQLNADLADTQAQLVAKQEELATLNHQRAEFLAYQAHQRWLAHQAWLKKQAEIKRAKELAAQQAREEAARRPASANWQRAAAAAGSTATRRRLVTAAAAAAAAARRTAATAARATRSTRPAAAGRSRKGWDAVNRAKQLPRLDVRVGRRQLLRPDPRRVRRRRRLERLQRDRLRLLRARRCTRWAPYKSLDHYSVTQYSQAGSYHPSSSSLLPGDLVFWSSNGAVSGIHHVAMYIGGGNVIQAPQSGSVITITPLWSVSSGYYGATRPLT